MYGGGDRRRSSSSPTPLSRSTSQCLFAAFLVHFAGGGEGAGEVSCGDGGGGSADGGLGPDLRCSGLRMHCSTGKPTASTRASAAASPGCGGGGWHLASNANFLYSCGVADV